MSIAEANDDLPGVLFNSGVDVTVDMLTALQQNVSRELIYRSSDFTKYPGFAWGLRVGAIVGRSVQISAGVGFDQEGIRMAHPQSRSYDIVFPETGVNAGYLYVKASPVNVAYRIHPYTGVRKPTENAISLEFGVVTSYYDDENGHIYPEGNEGLVVAKLTISGPSYTWEDVVDSNNESVVRSPYVVMQDGT